MSVQYFRSASGDVIGLDNANPAEAAQIPGLASAGWTDITSAWPPQSQTDTWDAPNACFCRGVVSTRAAIDALFDEKRSAGFTFGGKTYQCREIDLTTAIGWAAALTAGEVSPHDGRVRTIDDENVAFDDAALAVFCKQLQSYIQGLIHKRQDHHDAITAIVAAANALYPSDPAAAAYEADENAEDYDITVGWPVASYTTPEE